MNCLFPIVTYHSDSTKTHTNKPLRRHWSRPLPQADTPYHACMYSTGVQTLQINKRDENTLKLYKQCKTKQG